MTPRLQGGRPGPEDEDGRTINARGRTITLDVSGELDEYGQFRVAIVVDGKERWYAFFNDKSPD